MASGKDGFSEKIDLPKPLPRFGLRPFEDYFQNRKKIFSLILIEGMTITFIGSVIGIILGAIIFISVQYFSFFGTNIIIGQFEFISELLITWLIVIITSFLTCLIPCTIAVSYTHLTLPTTPYV